MPILNPFKKHDRADFPGTLVQLDQAHHRNSIASQRNQPIADPSSSPAEDKEKDDKSIGNDSDAHTNNGSIEAGTSRGLTLEELRREVETDLAASDTKSAYDREFLLT